jgi:hypothetical protein
VDASGHVIEPDLTPLDPFLRRFLKDSVYLTALPTNVAEVAPDKPSRTGNKFFIGRIFVLLQLDVRFSCTFDMSDNSLCVWLHYYVHIYV